MSTRFQNILDTILSFLFALLLAGGIIFGIYTLATTTAKTNAVVSFLNQQLATEQKQEQAQMPSAPVTTSAPVSK